MVANNKNQHFVPKAYLRRFSCDPPGADRRRINAYLIDHERFIDGASISDQCSKNKFYGSDEIFEDFVQHFEGRYGIAIEALEGNGQIYTGDISRFFLLQYLRTPHMLEQRRKTIDHAENLKIGGISRPEPMNFVQSRGCCQSNANSSPPRRMVPTRVLDQAIRFCHSARAAERPSL